MILNKIFIVIGIIFLYLGFSLFLSLYSNNILANNIFISKIFANITFDSQDSNTWFNDSNPTATVSTSADAVPAPVSITVITRRSH